MTLWIVLAVWLAISVVVSLALGAMFGAARYDRRGDRTMVRGPGRVHSRSAA